MSFRSTLRQLCSVKRLNETDVDGAPSYTWRIISANNPCMADIPNPWTQVDMQNPPEAGTRLPRRGSLFTLKQLSILPGDRVDVFDRRRCLIGTFEIENSAIPAISRHGFVSHWELAIVETSLPLGRS